MQLQSPFYLSASAFTTFSENLTPNLKVKVTEIWSRPRSVVDKSKVFIWKSYITSFSSHRIHKQKSTSDLEVEVDIWTHPKFSVGTPMLSIGSILNYRILRLGCQHCPLGQQGNVNTPSAFCSLGVKTKNKFSLIFLP